MTKNKMIPVLGGLAASLVVGLVSYSLYKKKKRRSADGEAQPRRKHSNIRKSKHKKEPEYSM